MSFQRVASLVALCLLSQNTQNVLGFTPSTPLCVQRFANPAISSKTAIRESGQGSSETSASEKATELKRKAEEAKRKAEELKKVAEAKAAAAMMAVKRANEKQSRSNGSESDIEVVAPVSSEENIEKKSMDETEIAAKIMIEKESEKMSAKADAVTEARNKASSRVIPREAAIIPINEATIEFTAGILGGFLALALGAGPVLAVMTAAAANYISKKDDLGELNELIQSISKASLSTYNWFAKLDAKYTVLGKISESLDDALNNLKSSSGESAEAIEKIEKTVAQTTKQLQKLAEETDFLEGSKQALGAVGEILESGIDKVADANREYKLTERAAEAAKSAAKSAIEKAKMKE